MTQTKKSTFIYLNPHSKQKSNIKTLLVKRNCDNKRSWMVNSNGMRLTTILNCANERCMHNKNVCTGLNKTTQSKLTNL